MPISEKFNNFFIKDEDEIFKSKLIMFFNIANRYKNQYNQQFYRFFKSFSLK